MSYLFADKKISASGNDQDVDECLYEYPPRESMGDEKYSLEKETKNGSINEEDRLETEIQSCLPPPLHMTPTPIYEMDPCNKRSSRRGMLLAFFSSVFAMVAFALLLER